MIISKNINIKSQLSITSDYIEEQLNLLKINPIRWAIVNSNRDEIIIAVSMEI